LRLVASPDGADGSLVIHQDARLYLATLGEPDPVTHEVRPCRHAWLRVLRGSVRIGTLTLSAGDGLAISDEPRIAVAGSSAESEVLLFDRT
jgi:redox-sensitive bicupin YhaK (pirin superfamily)